MRHELQRMGCGARRRAMIDDKPTISLAAKRKRKEIERDFIQERADLTKELQDIGVDPDKLAAIVQRVMFVEWAVFKAACMLEYHGVAQDPQAVIELVKILERRGDL